MKSAALSRSPLTVVSARFWMKSGSSTALRITLFLAVCLLPALALAQNDNWLGGAGSWSNGSMWSLGAPPSSSQNANIDNGNAKASAVTLDVNGATASNLTVDSDDSLNFGNFTSLTVSGDTISNAGVITLNGGNATNAVLNLGANTSFQGGGTVTLVSSGGGAIIQGSGFTLTNTNNTIQGYGQIGNGSMALSNAGTVNANVPPPPNQALFLDGTGGITNTNLLEATNGGILEIENNTVNNSGGNITANGSNSLVELASAVIQGGTLNSLNSGTLEAAPFGCSNSVTLDGSTHGALTLSTGSTFTNPDQPVSVLGTINNNGNIVVDGTNACTAYLNLTANTSLQGKGTVTLITNGGGAVIQGSGFTLTNTANHTIQGLGTIGNGSLTLSNAGTVNANQPGGANGGLFLNGTGGITNTNLLEATNGSFLQIANTVNNATGNITANGGTVALANAVIQGGTLNSLNSGTLEAAPLGCSNSVTLDGSTHGALALSSGSTLTNTNETTNLLGTINNNGNFQIVSNNGCFSFLNLTGNTTLQGKGKVTLSGEGGATLQGTGFTLTNSSNTIEGLGTIGNGALTLVNGTAGTIYANISGHTLVLNASGTITNNGTFKVASGTTLHVTNGAFTNFSGTTLTGGTYNTAGTLQIDELGTSGGEIVTNAAKIILSGATAAIVDQSGNNALPNFASNTKKGSFSLMSKSSLTTAGSVTNAGELTVGAKSTLKTGSSSYTQTSGTTTVDGTMTAPSGVDIQAGSLFGKGVISATVVSSGSVTAGDTTKKAGKLSMSTYTQNSGGSLNIQIGGTTLGTQYSQLAVGNGVSLNGTLNITLINNFVPAVGDVFTTLTGSAITGKFSTVNGMIFNSNSECFQVIYGASSVTLTAQAGTSCTNG